jgi:hypothetical protein
MVNPLKTLATEKFGGHGENQKKDYYPANFKEKTI